MKTIKKPAILLGPCPCLSNPTPDMRIPPYPFSLSCHYRDRAIRSSLGWRSSPFRSGPHCHTPPLPGTGMITMEFQQPTERPRWAPTKGLHGSVKRKLPCLQSRQDQATRAIQDLVLIAPCSLHT